MHCLMCSLLSCYMHSYKEGTGALESSITERCESEGLQRDMHAVPTVYAQGSFSRSLEEWPEDGTSSSKEKQ